MSFSLNAALRTCDVNTGEATRIQSDRFQNPNLMVCPVWNGLNSKGQQVCVDSFNTKTAGCRSAEDRVMVENVLRPQYSDYITLNAAGIAGNIYGNENAHIETQKRAGMLRKTYQHDPHFGEQLGAHVDYQGCSVGAYERAMAQEAQAYRGQAAMVNGYESYNSQRLAGF